MTSDEFETLVVVPARGGSKGLPGKNKMLLHGHPLVFWTLRLALKLEDTVVCLSSDDQEILKIGESLPGVIALRRPDVLSGDRVTDQPVLLHALTEVQQSRNVKFKRIAMLQPTAPGRDLDQLKAALAMHRSSQNPSLALWSVSEVPAHYNLEKQIINLGGIATINRSRESPPRRQDLQPTYIRNGEFYIVGIEALKDPYLAGDDLKVIVSKFPPINIDDISDFRLAELELVPVNEILQRKTESN